jgi:hypothetical protein
MMGEGVAESGAGEQGSASFRKKAKTLAIGRARWIGQNLL